MREKFARFMAGRYGTDQLNKFLLLLCAVTMLLSVLLRGSFLGTLLSFISILSIIVIYLRMLSRDRYKRSSENSKYLRIRYRVTNEVRMLKERWVQRKDYKFFYCPACHTRLRVPKGKGKVNIICRKCGNSFQGRT